MTQRPSLDLLGIGNAVVDVLAEANDADLATHGLTKGSMTLVDQPTAQHTQDAITPVSEQAGGSAANTLTGFALLGGRAGFIGKIRDDSLGMAFRRAMTSSGVQFTTPAAQTGPPTARCLILVTPDAERSMQTFLGASIDLSPADIDDSQIADAAMIYLEGYLWDPEKAKEALEKAARIAKAAGRKVALSLSDAGLVARHRQSLLDGIADYIDVLFANQKEAAALAQDDNLNNLCGFVRGLCDTVVVTRSEKGSIIFHRDDDFHIDPIRLSPPLDTTGAGDLYAAGFLHGLTHGHPLATCGRMGSLAGGESVTHYGARPESSLIDLFSRHRLIDAPD